MFPRGRTGFECQAPRELLGVDEVKDPPTPGPARKEDRKKNGASKAFFLNDFCCRIQH